MSRDIRHLEVPRLATAVLSHHQLTTLAGRVLSCQNSRTGYDTDPAHLPTDVAAVTDLAYARIAPKWWPGNPGAVLFIPRAHHENLYGLPAAVGHALWDLTQAVAVAVAMRSTYACEDLLIRQHN